jgi:hypothetical protein
MNIADVNNTLKTIGKKPTAKGPATNEAPVAGILKQRIADVRKQVGAALEQAQRLGATELAAKIRALSQQLAGMEASLAGISGTERRLVRMIKKTF